jgi:parallel beta-helix repeat protein
MFTSVSVFNTPLGFVGKSTGSTIYVNTTGAGGAYTSIQQAIDNANNGDTLFVYNGTYNENIVINKSISLLGKDKDTTIIYGLNFGCTVDIKANWVNISKFSIRNPIGTGIWCYYANNSWISNNDISSDGNGIDIYFSIQNNIIGNTFSNNRGSGISLYLSNKNNITDNYISHNDISGISLSSSKLNNITGNTITRNDEHGISLQSSIFNNISDNSISHNQKSGIYLADSNGSKLTYNSMIDDEIEINGNKQEQWDTYDIDSSNRVQSKPVYFWKNQTGGIIPKGAGQIILVNCSNVVVEYMDLNDRYIGIHLAFSDNNFIRRNNLANIEHAGIYLYYSNGNDISYNNISNSIRSGISLEHSDKNYINENNIFSIKWWGIYFHSAEENKISYNFINDNKVGLYFSNCSLNNITGNTVNSNSYIGIYLMRSTINHLRLNTISSNEYGIWVDISPTNYIYHNSIINNEKNGKLSGQSSYSNIWDNGYPSGGNYWSDFKGYDNLSGPNQNSTGRDGIGDSLHEIDFGNMQDNFPLMAPYVPSNITPQIQLITPANNSKIRAGTNLNYEIIDDNLNFADYCINDEEFMELSFPFNINTNGWKDGEYIVKINAVDSALNSNSSWYAFTVDSTLPSIQYNLTLIESTIRAGEIIKLNISDTHLDSVSISVDGGEYSEFADPYQIDTTDLSNGDHIISIKANDTFGNEIEEEFELSIDSIAPFVISTSPSNKTGNVKTDAVITIVFNEKMNTTNVDDYVFVKPADSSINPILSWDSSETVLWISFASSNLSKGTNYKIIIDSQIRDINGSSMTSDFELRFTTVSSGETGFLGSTTFGLPNYLFILLIVVILLVILFLVFTGKKKLSATHSLIEEKKPPQKKEKPLPPPPKSFPSDQSQSNLL